MVTGGASAAAAIATRDLEQAFDLAFGALLADQAEATPDAPITDEQLDAFAAAVTYLDGGGDRTAFAPSQSDAQFAQTVKEELADLLPAQAAQAMGVGDVFKRLGEVMKTVTDPLRDIGSDAVLKLIRKPLSDQVALFLGDIFVYLRWRETDGAAGTYNRIFAPIIQDLAAANKARSDQDRLVVVGHSLGAVILYDLLTDARALDAIKAASGGKALNIDLLATVGAQPGLFADMGLYAGAAGADGRLPRPPCARRWMNVYDFTDVLSFRTEPFFSDVKDYEFNNVTGALEAHTAYFQRPSFYKRLRARMNEA